MIRRRFALHFFVSTFVPSSMDAIAVEVAWPGRYHRAADDDPSGIATYSVAGAQFGTQLLWTALLTWPLMAAVQMMCARIGMVTGQGLAGNFRQRCVGLDFAGINPVKALYWTAVINGLLAPFLLVAILVVASNRKLMQGQPSSRLGWAFVAVTTVVMFAAGVAMFVV